MDKVCKETQTINLSLGEFGSDSQDEPRTHHGADLEAAKTQVSLSNQFYITVD